jgi:monooxygenase
VPAMAGTAAHVTMLQRSPSYIVSLPATDKISQMLKKVLPDKVVYRLARARNITIQRAMYAVARSRPKLVRKLVLAGAKRQLGPGADLSHFKPKYEPWDQRLCVVPDGDLFGAIREGRAEIVTDTIETFTASGVRLASGRDLEADIIITATGLQVQILGGAQISVDGEIVPFNHVMTYKGVLVEDVPNLAFVFGYTNASWTLKADIACEYVVRLLRYMDEHGYGSVVPRGSDEVRSAESVMSSLNSGYVQRGDPFLPRQGTTAPWRVLNNYLRDAPMLRRSPIADDALEFQPASVVSGRVRTPAG